MSFLQTLYNLQKKIFSYETKHLCRKKTITEKNLFSEEKPFMQKIHLLEIKVYNFFQLYNLQKKIFSYETKNLCRKKTITEKNLFSEEKPFMQKIHVLQIKVYNFF